jgi:gamma-glutamyltranspeptidase/glutathione hydrolase
VFSATPSGGWLQSSPTIPGARLPARHPRADVLARPGASERARPREAAAHDAVSLARAPRRRAYLAFGTPGGDQQDQWTLTFFPRAHRPRARPPGVRSTRRPSTRLTSRARSIPGRPSRVSSTSRRGSTGGRSGPPAPRARRPRPAEWSLGRVSAAGREPGGILKAAANPRGMQGYAVGR